MKIAFQRAIFRCCVLSSDIVSVIIDAQFICILYSFEVHTFLSLFLV